MLLECPNCGANFRVSTQALGEVGRTVRCSSCAFEWFAEPRDLKDATAPLPPEETEAEVAPEEQPAPEEFSEDVFAALEGFSTTADDVSFPALASPESAPRTRYLAPIAAVIVAMLFCASVALVYFREPLYGMGLKPLYDAIGLGKTEGVKLSGLSLQKVSMGERTRFIIKGSIVNTTKEAMKVPTVRIRMMDKDGTLLRGWEFSRDALVKAGESLPFTADRLDSTRSNAAHLFLVDVGSGFELAIRE